MKFFLIFLLFIINTAFGQQVINKLTTKDLTVNGKINVTSTTLSSRPCPSMTEIQRDALVAPTTGSCVYNNTQLKLNIYNGTIWKAAGGGIEAWTTSFGYSADDVVIQSSKVYQCLIAHTSGVFATDLAGGKWAELSQGTTDHTLLSNIGTNTHAQIDTHIADLANPHAVTKTQLGLSNVANVDTSTTANIADSADKRFLTDAEKTVIGNTSGANSGDLLTKGQMEGSTVSTSQIQTPYNQLTTTAAGERLIETGNANVLADPGAEALFTPWSAYKDAAGVLPVDGTGGTPDYISCINSSTGPLAGTKSFLITKQVAANAQGEGCSIPFTIPTSSTYKVNRLSFDYAIASGTYTDDQVEWFVYDVTNGVVKPFTPSKLKNHTLPSETFAPNGEFQASDSTSYRLIAHVASTSAANEWALKFDNFKLGVYEKTYGRGDTEYSAKVSSAGVVSDENRDFINGNCAVTSTNKLTCTYVSGLVTQAMNCQVKEQAVPQTGFFSTLVDNTTSNSAQLVYSTYTGTAAPLTAEARAVTISCQKSGTDYANASGLVMSNDADTRVVAAIIAGNPANTSANGVVIFPTVSKDTHGKYNPTTGEYTVPVTGYYKVSSSLYGSFGVGTFLVAVNGSGKTPVLGFNTASGTVSGSTTVFANAGEKITVYNTVALSSLSSYCGLTIEKISGPSQIAASESVSASYWLSANFTSSGTTPINFNSKEWDSHSAVTTSPTAWKFTAPSSGEYTIEGVVSSSTSSPTLTMWKGTSAYKPLVTATTPGYSYPFVAKIKLLQGEYISVRSYAAATFYGGTLDALSSSHISITRTGNF